MALRHYLFPLFIALLLLGLSWHLVKNPASVSSPQCEDGELVCVLANDILKDVTGLHFDLKRSQFDKKSLPIINLYLSDGALDKIDQKRRAALAKPGQILIGEDDDWVKGSIVVDGGDDWVKAKVELRLKGDWSDHYDHPTKLSFRVKVKGSGYIFGMKRFSIQHPKTRNYQSELLFIDEMRRYEILAPRYRFVDVRINDYRIGIMAMEEHFSKELLEAGERREGPIIALDEDLIWRQKDLNRRENVPRIENFDVNLLPTTIRDLPVRQFRPPVYVEGGTATHNSVRALSLYRDYVDGRVEAAEVFDLPKMAKWWVLANVWHACHGTAAHNRRFYFNPVTNLLEPIAFDNEPLPLKYIERPEPCDRFVANFLVGDPDFNRYVIDFAEQLLVDYSSPAWQENHRKSQIAGLQILRLDDFVAPVIYVKDLLANLGRFAHLISLNAEPRVVGEEPGSLAAKFPTATLTTHVRAFVSTAAEGILVEVKNLTDTPLLNVSVSVLDSDGINHSAVTITHLPSYAGDGYGHIKELLVAGEINSQTVTEVTYSYRGNEYKTTAVTQHRHHTTGFSRDFSSYLSAHPGVSIDHAAGAIVLTGGELILRESLELPRGWSLSLRPGTSLVLEDGATLKLRGPLFSQGTLADPVQVSIAPNLTYRGMGSWGGIIVQQAERESVVNHTIVQGAMNANLPNRQDYYGITGCLTFYESNTTVSNSQFKGGHCEDALNIVRAEFVLENVTITQSRADGFDSDFSVGSIRHSSFENIGNDAIDVSGTQLTLSESVFREIGDKAVSVGEQSQLIASGIRVDGASTGVASKDLSDAVINDSWFSNISGSALITYVKKSEYGNATIECNACNFVHANWISTNQTGSTIAIDGKLQSVTNFNQQQLIEAGYVGIE